MRRPLLLATVANLLLGLSGSALRAQDFTYNPPGVLVDGSGQGRVDTRVYVPDMRFPIENAPAYANSQVWGRGGSQGPGGSQCDAENFSYPWWDNYCESRSWEMPLCPAGVGHQGQDIRASSCADDVHWAVAAEAGTITFIGTYSVNLTTASGTLHRYLHMAPTSVVVSVGDTVAQGDRLGRVSDAFGDSSTTVHLHYDISMNVEEVGFVYVPLYLSLIDSYERLLGEQGTTCGVAGAEGEIIDNSDACFQLRGPPATWRYVDSAGYDGDLYWSFAWENSASNWAEWLFTVEHPGTWELEVYVTPAYSQAQDLRYSVRHAGGDSELRVDQSAGDGWLSIGTYSFEPGGAYNVAVYDGPGEDLALQRQFVADALRITPVDIQLPEPDPAADMGPDLDAGPDEPEVGPQPDADPDDAGSPDTGDDASPEPPPPGDVIVNNGCGCSASPTPSSPTVALFLLVMVVIGGRRRTFAISTIS